MADSSSGNFLTRLFASLFGSSDPEIEKKRILKGIAKDLSKSKYHFYKTGSDEVLPSFAKLFYEIYKAVSSAQTMFQGVENPNTFKFQIVDYSLSDRQREISESLTEEAIKNKASSMSVEKVKEETTALLGEFLAEFEVEKINTIELLYKQLNIMKSFCMYDFYFMLKKFDSSLREKEFTSVPKFDKINAEYIGDDLKDFITVAWVLPANENWTPLMKFFKETRGVEPVSPNIWNKIVNKMLAIKSSQTFEMMIQLITKDPEYVCDTTHSEAPIVDTYLEKIKNETQQALRKLQLEQQNSKVDSLLNQIFGTTAVLRLKNYTEQASAQFERKNLGKFLYCAPLNYYKAFLLDFVKKNLREFADLVLVRGAWATNALASPMSNAYHALLESSDTVLRFDESLAEEAEIGIKIKTLMPRVERERDARNILTTHLKDINELAKSYCVDGAKNLILVAKTIKMLLEDYNKQKPEMIINWKELDHFADHPVKQLGVEVYKEIYLFVTLMQNCLNRD